MNLKVGIIGLANVGKSTLFNALLKRQQAIAANYPFATIEPNIGVVPVPDERLAVLQKIVHEENGGQTLNDKRSDPNWPPIVPATVEFVDIAGLVKGASEGQGLGNKFLSHIREVSLICHVVRFFEDPNIIHIAGKVNPTEDKEVVETELILADLQTLNKQTEPKGKIEKEVARRWELVVRLKQELNAGNPARDVLDDEEKELLKDLQLLTMKPVLFVANVSEEQLAISDDTMVRICAKIESELSGLSDDEQKLYLKELGLQQSGLERLIAKAYQALGLISFLTAGVIEVRAWTIVKGTKAPQAAGVIHTDFEKKFIKAEVISFNDLVAVGTRGKAKESGLLRLEGKEYVMQNGDVVEFKVGA